MQRSKEGTNTNPIQILEDQEIEAKNKSKIQYERNRQQLYRAHMGSDFDVLMAVVKIEMQGTEQEKNQILLNRFYKFFSSNVKKVSIKDENFWPIRNPDYTKQNVYPVATELMVYGVDFLSAKQIRAKFLGLDGIQPKILWFDESHCKVIFDSQMSAKQAIEMNLKQKSEDSVKLQNSQELPRGWFELHSYTYFSYQRKLWCRYATSVQDETEKKLTNDYHIYQQAKKQFEQGITHQITADKYFTTMEYYKLIDKNKIKQQMQKRNNAHRNRDKGRNQRGRDWRGEDWGGDKNRNTRGFRRDNTDYSRNGSFGDFNRRNRRDHRTEELQNQNGHNSSLNFRSRQKQSQQDDNLSLISRGSKMSSRNSRPQNQASFSHSLRQQNEDYEISGSFSFILNQDELSNNTQNVIDDFADFNLGRTPLSPMRKDEEEKLNLSFTSNKGFKKQENNMSFDGSISLGNDSVIMKKSQINASFSYNQNESEVNGSKGKANVNQISFISIID